MNDVTQILQQIESGDNSWEAAVPGAVADVIKQKSYFGYRPASEFEEAMG